MFGEYLLDIALESNEGERIIILEAINITLPWNHVAPQLSAISIMG